MAQRPLYIRSPKGRRKVDVMKNETKLKNRYFQAVLYEDDPNFNNYHKYIVNNFKEVTWVIHDRDILDDNETRAKTHEHIMFKVGENARGLNSVANEIGINPIYLGGIKKIPFLRYLIHLDNPEKSQYKVEEVQGELKEELKKIIAKNNDEETELADITTLILNKIIKSNRDLMQYCINKHITYTMKKYSYILSAMIRENKEEMIIEKEKEKQNVNNRLRRKKQTR